MKQRYITVVSVLILLSVLFVACGAKKNNPQAPQTQGNTDPGGETKTPVETIPTPDDPIEPDDPIDPIEPDDPVIPGYDPDENGIDNITSQGSGYGDILRVKSTGQIMFSPYITELKELVDIGENLDDYQMELIFILLNEKGSEYYAYPKLMVPITLSSNGWFDIFLQGEGIDCGFCPTAEQVYTIEVTIYTEGRAVLEGTWQSITASSKYPQSEHYRPTPLPTPDDLANIDCTVEYKVQGDGGVIEGPAKQELKSGQASVKVTAVAKEGYMFSGWSDSYPGESREGETFIRNKVIYAKFTKIELDAGIPNMYIDTETGNPIKSRHDYINATIRIVGALQDKFNVTLSTQIRGRGNSSFSGSSPQDDYNSKNSYRLKLDEKTNLLGVGSASNRDWVLNANKFDASNLRNYFIWHLSNQMDNFPFVPSCTWVNLYINGDYRGIYMVTDLIEAADNRVEVDDSGNDPDKGYLIELDFRGADEDDVVEGLHYFYVPGFYDPASGISNPREWVIKSDVNSTAETDFIRDYIIRCHSAIMSGNREAIDELVDIPSLIDMFIVEELSKDVDAGGASLYMQKDKGGKLCFTAPWDFDFGFGTYGPATSTYGFVCESRSGDPNIWFAALMSQKWFLEELGARLKEIASMIEISKEGISTVGAFLTPAADRNDVRWDIYGRGYHQYVSYQASSKLYSYEEHITFLCDWIDERFTWMTEEIAYRLSL